MPLPEREPGAPVGGAPVGLLTGWVGTVLSVLAMVAVMVGAGVAA